MKVKPTKAENAVGLIDPQTKRSPFLDAEGNALESADVPENNFWVRRLLAGEIVRIDAAPLGNEPVAPLTTRKVKE